MFASRFRKTATAPGARRKGDDMATYRYELRSTTRPFGPCERVSVEDYTALISRHTTLSAAERALERENADMVQRCGQSAWDSHTAIIPLRDVTLSQTERCVACGVESTISRVWKSGALRPHFNHAPGWEMGALGELCPAHTHLRDIVRYDELCATRKA
jgi:hypothetical protein